jgi:proline iminopeptidase
MGVVALVIAALILGGLAGYLLSLLAPGQPKGWFIVTAGLIVVILIAVAAWLLLDQEDQASIIRYQLTGGTITETPEFYPETSLDLSADTYTTTLASPALPATINTVYQVFPYFVGQERTYNYRREMALPSVDGQVIETATDTGTFTESTAFIETGNNDRVRVVGLEQTGENPASYCAVDPAPNAFDIWIVADATRLYRVCSREEAYAIAGDILNEDEQGPTERTLAPTFEIPLEVGHIWRWDPYRPVDEQYMDYQWYVHDKVDVSVPAGNFTGCYRIVLSTLPDTTIKSVCPGLGLVAEEYQHGGSTHEYRIELSKIVHELEVKSGDETLHVQVAGKGPSQQTLITIGGGPGLSAEYMVDLEQLAGPELAVITYDQRGTGRSSRPAATPANYELADYTADLEAVRAAVGAEQVHLLGHSWGGLVAMEYATRYPDKVSSLILVDSYPPTDTAFLEAMDRHRHRISELQGVGLIMDPLPGSGVSLMDAVLPAHFSDPAFDFPFRDVLAPSYNYQASDNTSEAIRGYDLTAGLSTLDLPALILWGEDDSFGLFTAEATRDSLSAAGVQFELLANCGHYWHECPGAFYPLLKSFLGLSE